MARGLARTVACGYACQVWAKLVISALIIGLAVIGAQFIGRYQIAPAVGANGNPFAWRLNVITGDVQVCNIHIKPADKNDPFSAILGEGPTETVMCGPPPPIIIGPAIAK